MKLLLLPLLLLIGCHSIQPTKHRSTASTYEVSEQMAQDTICVEIPDTCDQGEILGCSGGHAKYKYKNLMMTPDYVECLNESNKFENIGKNTYCHKIKPDPSGCESMGCAGGAMLVEVINPENPRVFHKYNNEDSLKACEK